MDNCFDKEENAKNIYVIKHKLSELKRRNNDPSSPFIWEIGAYVLYIYTPDAYDPQKDFVWVPTKLYITQHDQVKISLSELVNRYDNHNTSIPISLDSDPRLKNFNLKIGGTITIIQLCELIRYLHRLSNLAVFL